MSLPQQWNIEKIKEFKQQTGQALLSDESTLVSFSHDFGKLIESRPSAVCIPQTIESVSSLVSFANQHRLPITIRGNGMSQCGQSLPTSGGLTLSMQHFNKPLELEENSIWVEANTSWANLLEVSLSHNKAPFVLPYNCNLSVGGVLSAGGVGSSSFKYGTINAHVKALEVIDGTGAPQRIDTTSPLFHACLSGQGRFAVITKACIELREVLPQVKTFYLVYSDQQQWFDDMNTLKDKVDYMELFCSPSIQGAKLKGDKRVPMAQWLYGLHLTIEFDKDSSRLNDAIAHLKPLNVINTQEETIASYLLRHNSRFEVMKMLGQWDLLHPWYECFIPTKVLNDHLEQLLQEIPVYYANLIHVVPMSKQKPDFLMMPEDDSVCSIMILNPGVPAPLKDGCLQAIEHLDSLLIPQGGKRYLSGFLGKDLPPNYWVQHFDRHYSSWMDVKKHYDPNGIFCSLLHTS